MLTYNYNRKGRGELGPVRSSTGKLIDPNLPEEIVCSVCKQLHSQGDYSDPQLASLIDKIERVGLSALVNQSSAKCNGCCGSPNLEYKCRFCRCWKAIECFARNQRPLAEPACKDCQDGVQGSAQPWRSKEQKMIEDAARAKQEQELSQRLSELAANPLQLAVVPRALQWEDPADVKDWSELVDLHGLLQSGTPQEKEKSMIRRVRLLAQRLRRNQATREEQRLEVARAKADVDDGEKPAYRKIQDYRPERSGGHRPPSESPPPSDSTKHLESYEWL